MAGKGKKPDKQGNDWAEAKRRCRLSAEEVRMAKELGFKPRSLIKNIPAKSQPWKAPVSEWIRDLHAKRFGQACEPEGQQDPANPTRRPASKDVDPRDMEDLLPQWDTVNEEPYFIRESDGRTFSLEEAGGYFSEREAVLPDHEEDDITLPWEDDLYDNSRLSEEEVDGDDRNMLRRQEEFRLAAEAVAEAMSQLPQVERIVLFGSVAKPLKPEVPRFRKYRRARVEIFHECKDVDLAVWVNNLNHLRLLQKARSRALNELLASRGIGVAHHQVDVFLMEPGTDRYIGRLCIFAQCPKGKGKCRVEGCGEVPLVQQHEDFVCDWPSASQGSVTLYDVKVPY